MLHMKALRDAFCFAMALAPAAAYCQQPSANYFPPPESEGGWQHAVEPNQEPDAATKQSIREKLGIDWDKLHAAWQWDLANVGGGQKCLLVIRHGTIVGEWYNERTASDYIHVASAGKSFVSTSLARLFSNDELWPDDFVYEYMPTAWGQSDPERKKIQIKHILTMTSGLKAYDGPYEPDAYRDVILSLPVVSKPGTVWAYSTGPLDLMNYVIEKKSGLDLGGYVNEKILAP